MPTLRHTSEQNKAMTFSREITSTREQEVNRYGPHADTGNQSPRCSAGNETSDLSAPPDTAASHSHRALPVAFLGRQMAVMLFGFLSTRPFKDVWTGEEVNQIQTLSACRFSKSSFKRRPVVTTVVDSCSQGSRQVLLPTRPVAGHSLYFCRKTNVNKTNLTSCFLSMHQVLLPVKWVYIIFIVL